MAPKWMKKLTKAKWNVNKLNKLDEKHIRCDTSTCFIGEIYCMTNDYTNKLGEGYCEQCVKYCALVPLIIDDYHMTKEKEDLLSEIAVHMKTKHADMIGKKFLGVD